VNGVRALAHAKLNLRLAVVAREASGYHQIETLFCLIELADEVEVALADDDITLDVTHHTPGRDADDLGPPELNLAVRAAREFQAAAGVRTGAAIRLTKHIPAGAGLGGGSSDAAAVLRALNELHGEPLDMAALMRVGATLGSDVPFFVAGCALALGWGRGGRLMALPPLPPRAVLLAVPRTGVSTADAYAQLAARRGAAAAEVALLPVPPLTWRDVQRIASNDFEDVIFERLPRLAGLKRALESAGAAPALMTGSGSVVFGVFEDGPQAVRAVEERRGEFEDVRCVWTRTVSDAVAKFPGVDSNHH
jgi:4-diphosphocytidyl-2-C-methyl-D-erythritol kinase